MSPAPPDVSPVQIQVVPTPAAGTAYEIQFVPGPKDPQPEIYYAEPGKPRAADLKRRVQWEWVGVIPADHYIRIVPKAYNSQIFVGPAPKGMSNDAKQEREKFLLDHANRFATSLEPIRGPKMNLGLAWYYGVHLYKHGQPGVVARFPPPVVDATEGQEIAYLDPVVVIKDE